jgi:hypothetical protein
MKGERTKELSFRLWKEGKSVAEIQAQICRNSKPLEESIKQWVTEWERGRQAGWESELPNREPRDMNGRILLLTLGLQLLILGTAHAQYTYLRHPAVLVEQGATVAVLPANPRRAFVYCVITSPSKGEAFAPLTVVAGNATTGVPLSYPDRVPQLWGNSGEVWVFSDQNALISCTELVRRTAKRQ